LQQNCLHQQKACLLWLLLHENLVYESSQYWSNYPLRLYHQFQYVVIILLFALSNAKCLRCWLCHFLPVKYLDPISTFFIPSLHASLSQCSTIVSLRTKPFLQMKQYACKSSNQRFPLINFSTEILFVEATCPSREHQECDQKTMISHPREKKKGIYLLVVLIFY